MKNFETYETEALKPLKREIEKCLIRKVANAEEKVAGRVAKKIIKIISSLGTGFTKFFQEDLESRNFLSPEYTRLYEDFMLNKKYISKEIGAAKIFSDTSNLKVVLSETIRLYKHFGVFSKIENIIKTDFKLEPKEANKITMHVILSVCLWQKKEVQKVFNDFANDRWFLSEEYLDKCWLFDNQHSIVVLRGYIKKLIHFNDSFEEERKELLACKRDITLSLKKVEDFELKKQKLSLFIKTAFEKNSFLMNMKYKDLIFEHLFPAGIELFPDLDFPLTKFCLGLSVTDFTRLILLQWNKCPITLIEKYMKRIKGPSESEEEEMEGECEDLTSQISNLKQKLVRKWPMVYGGFRLKENADLKVLDLIASRLKFISKEFENCIDHKNECNKFLQLIEVAQKNNKNGRGKKAGCYIGSVESTKFSEQELHGLQKQAAILLENSTSEIESKIKLIKSVYHTCKTFVDRSYLNLNLKEMLKGRIIVSKAMEVIWRCACIGKAVPAGNYKASGKHALFFQKHVDNYSRKIQITGLEENNDVHKQNEVIFKYFEEGKYKKLLMSCERLSLLDTSFEARQFIAYVSIAVYSGLKNNDAVLRAYYKCNCLNGYEKNVMALNMVVRAFMSLDLVAEARKVAKGGAIEIDTANTKVELSNSLLSNIVTYRKGGKYSECISECELFLKTVDTQSAAAKRIHYIKAETMFLENTRNPRSHSNEAITESFIASSSCQNIQENTELQGIDVPYFILAVSSVAQVENKCDLKLVF